MQVLLFLVFVVAVTFGTWFFGYGLSLLRGDLEPQVPDALRDAPQKDDQTAKGAMQVLKRGADIGYR
jgi:hypothetical protein